MAPGGVGRGGAPPIAKRYRFDCFVTNPNRPEKRNAMSPHVCFDMVDVLTRLDTDPETKVLVLTSAFDFAIAADEATFGLSEVNWRILPTAPSLRAVEIGGLIAILLPWERMDGVR